VDGCACGFPNGEKIFISGIERKSIDPAVRWMLFCVPFADRVGKEKFLPVTLEQDGALSLIRLQGAIDIFCAQELRELLVQGLKTASEVRVLLAGATDMDVTAVQLLWAARREAKASSVKFAFEGAAPEPVSAALAEAGLEMFTATGETN
jgi:anti-anti-sigma regulatory factor